MHVWAGNLPRKPNNNVSEEPRQNKGRELVDRKLVEAPPPVVLLLAIQGWLFCFSSLVVLDVVCGYLLFSSLDIKIEKT